MLTTPLAATTFLAATLDPPMVLPVAAPVPEPSTEMPKTELPIAVEPFRAVPIRLPSTRLFVPPPARWTPADPLAEITLRAPRAVPPMVLPGPCTSTPSVPLPSAAVPSELVPM